MTIRVRAMQADVRLDRWSAAIPIEDRSHRLQPHALVGAVEQLAEEFDRQRR